MDTTDQGTDEATPAEAVEGENGEAEPAPEDGTGEEARRHASRLEQHSRPAEEPTEPSAGG